ncbi:BofC C-terminal domain-containing protein [Paenibacillus sp. OV219]|uniref:BofC C-terminal domain-containing protein n=1 Tax=Paenibacillus sp. OV219 TaxID=1884377 RepID=UPI0008BAE4BB|nr:BofC C-terminal domain-containing protein [Paenibacillus sp. OV219]SEM68226.1 forespore regulator of the sigma-K checkpoint [Paenibacillus sp. OV219]
MEFSLWKKIKQKLRRSRRPMWQLGSMIAAVMLLFSCTGNDVSAAEPDKPLYGSPSSVIETLSGQSEQVNVKLRLIYLCGDEMKTLGKMSAKAALSMLAQHPEWNAVMHPGGAVVMEQRVDDLSDSCKRNGYISLDKSGNLTMFDGSPKEKKVMRTFFQLDVRYMESSLPKERIDQLMNGIRINDKDEFNSVISTFSDYAIDRNEKVEKVMKRSF